MRTWSRRHTAIAGLALILATNAIALLGVGYNRSGEPDGVLQLTQRELALPYAWGLDSENSGIALTLQWRMLPAKTGESADLAVSGSPDWLDEAKLAALGFDVALPDPARRPWRTDRQLSREVLLVLEFDGSAYREALERAREHARQEAALLAANPGKEEFRHRASSARDWFAREEQENTRLFVIDAGLDATALRAAYPDRSRHVIVRGQVRPHFESTPKPRLQGYVTALAVERINLPHAFRHVFEPQPQVRTDRPDQPLGYAVTVAFGKRFEPWIIAVQDRAASR